MGVAVRELEVLRADVLRPPVPVVVRVVAVVRDEPAQELDEAVEEAVLRLGDPDAARGVRGVDACDAVLDAALADGLDARRP